MAASTGKRAMKAETWGVTRNGRWQPRRFRKWHGRCAAKTCEKWLSDEILPPGFEFRIHRAASGERVGARMTLTEMRAEAAGK